jgi:hypothetical protein
MDRQAHEQIVNTEMHKQLDICFPYGEGRALRARVEHALGQVAAVAFEQGRRYAILSLLTIDDAMERINNQLPEPISRRRMLAIARNRHERWGVGFQVGNTGVWLFTPEQIDVLIPNEKYRSD